MIHCYEFISLINMLPSLLLRYCVCNNLEKLNSVKHLCKAKNVIILYIMLKLDKKFFPFMELCFEFFFKQITM